MRFWAMPAWANAFLESAKPNSAGAQPHIEPLQPIPTDTQTPLESLQPIGIGTQPHRESLQRSAHVDESFQPAQPRPVIESLQPLAQPLPGDSPVGFRAVPSSNADRLAQPVDAAMPDSNAAPTIAPRVAVPERADSIASSVAEPARAATGYSTERLPPIPSTASTSTTEPKQTSPANNSEAREIKSQAPRSLPADSAAARVARKAEPQKGAASRAGERATGTKHPQPTAHSAVKQQAEQSEFGAAGEEQTRTISPQQTDNTTSATSAVLDHASETPSPVLATSPAATDPSPAVPAIPSAVPATIATPVVAATVTAKPEASPLSNPDAATPSQSSVPGVHADLGSLAVKIAARSREGDRHFDIRLDPPELGRIDVHLFVDQSGRAQAHLSADKPHTLALLQRDSAELQRGLKDAGLELSNSGLNFSLKGQEQRDGTPQFMPRPRQATPALAEAPAVACPLPATSYTSNARLDIRV